MKYTWAVLEVTLESLTYICTAGMDNPMPNPISALDRRMIASTSCRADKPSEVNAMLKSTAPKSKVFLRPR